MTDKIPDGTKKSRFIPCEVIWSVSVKSLRYKSSTVPPPIPIEASTPAAKPAASTAAINEAAGARLHKS